MNRNGPIKSKVTPLMVVKFTVLVTCTQLSISGIVLFILEMNVCAVGSFLILEVLSYLLLQLTHAVFHGRLHAKYTISRLKFINILSIVLTISQLGSTIAYLVMAVVGKQDFHLEHDGYYAACIPSILAILMGFRLACESRHYMEGYNEGAPTPKTTVEFVNVLVQSS